MKLNWFRYAGIALGLYLAAVPAWAHHSLAAEYDDKKPADAQQRGIPGKQLSLIRWPARHWP